MNKLNKEKLNMWKKKEEELRRQLKSLMIKRGQAALDGDLSENAAFQGFTDEAEMISAQLGNVQKTIQNLERDH